MADHLLAMLVEVTSVGVAGKSLKRPIQLPRPGEVEQKPQPGQSKQDAAFKKGIATLASTTRGVRRD